MPKKVSESEKKAILESFLNGANVNEISNNYKFTSITIVRQLKKILGNNTFEEIKRKNADNFKKGLIEKKPSTTCEINKKNRNENLSVDEFFEIVPVIEDIDTKKQKDLTSEPLSEVNLPKLVYMLVDKKIELIPKLLGDYPHLSYMPQEDLKRMTLEIFDDQRHAKKCCSKNQKLIKVPNPKVFLLASNILKSKGITRIIFNDSLFSL